MAGPKSIKGDYRLILSKNPDEKWIWIIESAKKGPLFQSSKTYTKKKSARIAALNLIPKIFSWMCESHLSEITIPWSDELNRCLPEEPF